MKCSRGWWILWLGLVAMPLIAAEQIPALDTRHHSVPLQHILFDTFDGGAIALPDASARQIAALRDAIKPIYRPHYEEAKAASWLADAELVLGYVSVGGKAYAFPLKMLNYHELVNDRIEGLPLLISYCPLCASAVIYRRQVNGRELLFGNTSALYESDLVMFDHQTGSYWFQVAGEAIVGPLTGARLSPLPSSTLSWGAWRALYPHTQVLAQHQPGLSGYDYRRDSFRHYAQRVAELDFRFPVSVTKISPVLGPAEVVVSVHAGMRDKAYPLARIGPAVVNDQVGDVPIVLFSDGLVGHVYSPRIAGRVLHFRLGDGVIQDDATASHWNPAGVAVAGPMTGARLAGLPTRRAFWFALSLALPEIEVYRPQQ